jgi:hypothetical protein
MPETKKDTLKRQLRVGGWLALPVIYAIHLFLVLYALPIDVLLDHRPFDGTDYQTHYQQLTTLTEMVDDFGHLWGYDPNLLAGQPAGLIFDVDNKLHFLFAYGLNKAGVSLPVAFKLFTLFSCLLLPFSIWGAARLFRLGVRAETIAMGFGILLWHFDYSARFVWTVGMISFATASHLAVLTVALFYRFLNQRSWTMWFAVSVALALNLLTHVWAFGILVLPLTGLYIKHRKELGRLGHIQVWSIALLALAANLYWLLPALRHIDYLVTSGIVGQATPLYVLSDWLEILINPFNTGFAVPHTFFRFLAVFCVVILLWRWRKENDERFFVALICLAWTFGMAYCAALIPGLKETEPYRFVIPGVYFAGIFASPILAEALSPEFFRGLSARGKTLAVVLLLLLLPRVAEQVLFFIPSLAPAVPPSTFLVNQARLPTTAAVPPLDHKDGPDLLYKRIYSINDRMMHLVDTLNDHCEDEGRVLVQHWAVGEFLRWSTSKPIIGGFPDRRIKHEAANIFHRFVDPRYGPKEFANYLVRYNIRYIVMTDYFPHVEARRDLLTPYKLSGPHRIYRVKHLANYFSRGSGKVEASLNRIAVSNAKADARSKRIDLRFHYMRSLRCRPNCTVSKLEIPFDPVGFISVTGNPDLPKDFVIEQHY